MNAPAEQLQETVLRVPLDDLAPSPMNPRKHLGDLTELAASIKEVDIIEPLVARDLGKLGGRPLGLELVFGHRRLAAAKIAGKKDAPVIVRDYSDDEVFEVQVVENSQRADVHPLDEADGFKAMVEHGYSTQRLADRIGRSLPYVLQRLKLCTLSKACRKALDEETLPLGVALLLARLPSEKLQDEALNDVAGDRWEGPMSVEEAKKHLETDYMLRLDEAPFDRTDAKLVPKAGACSACPKRTGAQRELFADVKSADLCTDPPCFKSKVDALWQIRKREAEKGGTKVLEGKAADAALRYGGSHVSLESEEWTGSKQVKVRKLFGKDLPAVTLARGHDGKVLELVPRADFVKMMREKHPKEAPAASSGDGGYAARQKREEKKLKIRRTAVRTALAEAVENASNPAKDKVLGLIVRAFAGRAWNEVQRDVLERRGVKATAGNVEGAILKLAKGMSPADVLGLGLELALRAGAPWHTHNGNGGGIREIWAEGLKLCGVNFAQHERVAQAEAKQKKGSKRGLVHLAHTDNPKGTACGARPGTGVGSGVRSYLAGVTCENCKRVGPSVLKQRRPAKKRGRRQ